MRQWIVLIQVKSRREYPELFVFEGSSEEAKELEDRIRALFDAGKIKNFAFQPIRGPFRYEHADEILGYFEGRPRI